jgi:serine/threonine-protein kinase
MLERTQATTAMPPRARRQLQPIDEPTPPPRRAPAARRQSAPPPAAARRRSGGGIGRWVALLVVLALVAGGLAAYQAANSAGDKAVQLRKDVSGKVDRAAEELRGLIEDNTQ